MLDGFPGEDEANGILTYGYYDREVGLTLEVLAAALMDGEHARFGVSSNTISSKIRIDVVAEDNCFFFLMITALCLSAMRINSKHSRRTMQMNMWKEQEG